MKKYNLFTTLLVCIFMVSLTSSSSWGQKPRSFTLLEQGKLPQSENQKWNQEFHHYIYGPDLLGKTHRIQYGGPDAGLKTISLFFTGVYNREKGITEAFNAFQEALSQFENQRDTVGVLACHLELSRLHLSNYSDNLGDIDKAKYYAEKGAAMADRLGDPTWRIMSKSAISLYYYSKKPRDFPKYTTLENERYAIAEKFFTPDNPLWGVIYLNQGNIEEYKGNLRKQIDFLKKAEAILTPKFPNRKMRILALNNLGIAYAQNGEAKSSLQTFKQALKEIGNDSLSMERLNVLRNLSVYYELVELDPLKSKQYLDSATTLQASIFESKRILLLNELEKRLETTKFKQQNELLQAENENVKQRMYFLIGIAVLLVAIISLFIYGLRKQNKLNRALESLLEEKEKLEIERQNLWSIIAHDLRQPIHSLIGISGLLKSSQDVTRVNQFGGMLEQTVVGIKMNLDNILSFSKMKAQFEKYAPEYWNMGDLVDSSLTIYKGYTLFGLATIEIVGSKATQVWMDSISFHFILRNLLDNALKFQARGEIKPIQIRWEHASESVVKLEVIDLGEGIKQEELQKINHYFSHLQEDNQPGHSFGLGLSIIKQHAIKNHIQLHYEKITPDSGTRVTILIPAHKV